MSLYWHLRCDDCGADAETELNHGDEVLRAVVRVARHVAPVGESGRYHLDLHVQGYGGEPYAFAVEHMGHRLALASDVGHHEPVDAVDVVDRALLDAARRMDAADAAPSALCRMLADAGVSPADLGFALMGAVGLCRSEVGVVASWRPDGSGLYDDGRLDEWLRAAIAAARARREAAAAEDAATRSP
jgi:hypothetical protein